MAKSGTVDVGSDIERGRELCAEQDWAAAYSCLSAIDPVLLSATDLELLAGWAYMLGREDAYVDAWELAYEFTAHLATLQFPPPELEPVLAAVQSNQESMDEFAQVGGAVTSPADFLSEQNVARLLAAAGEPPPNRD